MKKNEKASLSLIKFIAISAVLLILFSGIGVMAANAKITNVKIILSNGYEMDVLTTKTKVADILEEAHVTIKEEETVIPKLEEELTDNKTIRITTKEQGEQEENKEIAQEATQVSLDQILEEYEPITEKIVTEQVEIPFETVTKDVSDGARDKQNKVLQEGKNGLKEITYNIKYQKEEEIERKEISSKIIKEPVDKIIQVNAKVVTTSRSEATRGTTTASSGKYEITAYCACRDCCGKTNGITAMGTKATAGRTVAAPSTFAFGTKLKINGQTYTVEDRGGAIKGNKIDIYMPTHSAALAWGVRYLDVQVVK